jgi:thiamine biosynthesis lipoprotein
MVRVEQIMGTAISIHVLTAPGAPAIGEEPFERCFADLRDIDRVFSTYRDDSDISRLRRGESFADLDPRLTEVADACEHWRGVTRDRFSATWQGWFDPTGYVKGWSVENAARRHLAPLIERPGVIAAGINAGGDLQLFTADAADWAWNVGIADPTRPGEVIATLGVVNGAVATSGTAERGAHIVDPRSGQPAQDVISATVVADGLAEADVWATTAVVAGFDDLSWISDAATRTGLVIGARGDVRRWVGTTEVSVRAAAAHGPSSLLG